MGYTQKPLKKDQAYGDIKQLILGNADATMIYSERFLAAELKFGLAPIRAAIARLVSEGVVEAIPKAGIRLPQLSYREVMEFFELRLLIEPYIAEKLAGQLNGAQSDELSTMMAAQKQAAEEGDTESYHALDLAFHSALARFYGNQEMIHALAQMRDKMFRLSRHIHTTRPGRLQTNAAQHAAVVAAILSNQPERAREEMRLHILWGRDVNIAPSAG